MRGSVRSLPFRSMLLAVLVGAAWLTAVPTASAATLTVNTTDDTSDGQCNQSPDCTLREAILVANATAAKDTIHFNLSSATPVIAVGSSGGAPLPTITHPVEIDGTSGASTRIELNGSSAGTDADGLTLTGGGSTVKGMVVEGFDGNGIVITTAGGNVIVGSRIGTNAAGTAAAGNGRHGILIQVAGAGTFGVGGNVIGGTTPAARNLISGNALNGVVIVGSNGNLVQGNRIGTDVSGQSAIPNGQSGVVIIGSKSNVVGGSAAGAGNLISGNTRDGVDINDASTGTSTSGNAVQGNLIGTNAAGTADLGNGVDGIHMEGFPINNLVGGTTPGARNVISGNGADGVDLALSGLDHHETISGNYIGTDITGNVAIGNGGAGVHLDAARKNVIGGTTPGSGNVISGNAGDGIRLDNNFGPPEAARGNVIRGNLIGTNAAGSADLGNLVGIHILDQPDNVIGGTTAGARNVVSGNALGMEIASLGTVIQGNYVGTDVSGTNPIPNESDGITVSGFQNEIGGPAKGAGNVIAFNGPSIVGGNGVTVKSSNSLPIQGNSIFSNSLLGIDLDDDGVTPNDPLDADSGANELQNFPVLNLARSNGTLTHVAGKVASEPNTDYVVEIFSTAQCDPSGNGEGGRFLGRATVTTGGAGNGSFDLVFHKPTPVNQRLTATATSTANSTSEFGPCRKVVSGS